MSEFAAKDAALYNKKKFFILCDMAWCALRYSAAVYDYHNLKFAQRPHKERKDFVTMGVNVKLVKRVNNLAYRPIFEDKTKFNATFREFLKREWCNLQETDRDEFTKWLNNLNHNAAEGSQVLFAKRDDSSCGADVLRIVVSDYADAGTLYDFLITEKFDLIEEAVYQHEFMAGIYPGAVNTLRIASFIKDGIAHVPYAFLRCGLEGYVDNLNAGGFCAVIDAETGIITSDGMTKDMQYAETHPVTGFTFNGAQFPYWDECIALVKEAAMRVPQVRYAAWDVAIRHDGEPLFIEGNYHPGYDILQLADQVGKKKMLLSYR